MSVEAVVASISFAASVIAVAGWGAGVWRRLAHRRTVRRFFGGDDLTVYLPLRSLGGRLVVDEADFQASVKLVREVIGPGVETRFRFVTPEGDADLGSDGLVVICGPKSSRDVARVMESDPRLRFAEEDGVFTIRDLEHDRIYCSPIDMGEPHGDIGYLARGVRRSGVTSTFVSIAGVHAPGSAGVVHWLSDRRNLRRLYRKTRNRLFSSVIECDLSTGPMRIASSRMLVLHVGERPAAAPRPGVVVDKPPILPETPGT